MRTIVVTFFVFGGLQLAAQDMDHCPMHKKHMNESSQHQANVKKHGDEAMGFPHDKTTHHFRLYPDGGAIEVTADDSNDSTNIEAIRAHLEHIVMMFSKGDFSTPMFVHDQVPPGVPVMKEKRAEISYSLEELPASGRVRIKTTNHEAQKAIHAFLRFQIDDHHTGDNTDIQSPGKNVTEALVFAHFRPLARSKSRGSKNIDRVYAGEMPESYSDTSMLTKIRDLVFLYI